MSSKTYTHATPFNQKSRRQPFCVPPVRFCYPPPILGQDFDHPPGFTPTPRLHPRTPASPHAPRLHPRTSASPSRAAAFRFPRRRLTFTRWRLIFQRLRCTRCACAVRVALCGGNFHGFLAFFCCLGPAGLRRRRRDTSEDSFPIPCVFCLAPPA